MPRNLHYVAPPLILVFGMNKVCEAAVGLLVCLIWYLCSASDVVRPNVIMDIDEEGCKSFFFFLKLNKLQLTTAALTTVWCSAAL